MTDMKMKVLSHLSLLFSPFYTQNTRAMRCRVNKEEIIITITYRDPLTFLLQCAQEIMYAYNLRMQGSSGLSG